MPSLLKAGTEVKALVRNPDKAEKLQEQGATVVTGEFTDAEAVRNTFEGAQVILLIVPASPDAAKQMSALISAAKISGNPHIVRMSAIKAAVDAPTANGILHYESDTELMESGLPYTILRPHFFMQNIWTSISTIQQSGQIYWGMGDGKIGIVDVRDIADVAVALLLEGSYQGEILTLTRPESITFSQVAEAISDYLVKKVTYVPITYEQVKQSILEMGWGEWGAQVMHDYSKAYSEGWGDFTTADVEKVTGHKPRSIKQFVSEVLAYGFQQTTT